MNSVATVRKIVRGTNDGKNDTLIASESDWIANSSDSVIQIDDLDEDVVIGVGEAEPTDDIITFKNGAKSNSDPNKVENDTNATQNASDIHNSDNE